MTTKLENDSLNDIVGTSRNKHAIDSTPNSSSVNTPFSDPTFPSRYDGEEVESKQRKKAKVPKTHVSERSSLNSHKSFLSTHHDSYGTPSQNSAAAVSTETDGHHFSFQSSSNHDDTDATSTRSSDNEDVGILISNSMSSDNDDTSSAATLKKIRYTLGLFSLAFVIVTWVASSVMIQKILDTYEKPVFMTYCFTSLFMMYFPVYFLQECLKKRRLAKKRQLQIQDEQRQRQERMHRIATLGYSFEDAMSAMTAPDPTQVISSPDELACQRNDCDENGTVVYNDLNTSNTSDEHAEPLLRSTNPSLSDEVDPELNNEGLEPLVGDIAPPGVLQGTLPTDTDEIVYASFGEHFRTAMLLAPLWFSMNYMFNVALNLTSVASNTVLTNTSSLFVLLINFFAFKERPGWIPVIGAICTIGGAAMVSFADDDESGSDKPTSDLVLGDIITMISSIVYASYTVLLETKVGKQEHRINITYVFGCIGLCNVLTMWPVIILRHIFEYETFELPDSHALLWMFINGLVGTALSDYMWGQAVVLTSPLLCTLGLSLTTPLGMFSDWFFHSKQFKFMYIVGCIILVGGFLLVNYKYTNEIATEEKIEQEEEAMRVTELAEVVGDDEDLGPRTSSHSHSRNDNDSYLGYQGYADDLDNRENRQPMDFPNPPVHTPYQTNTFSNDNFSIQQDTEHSQDANPVLHSESFAEQDSAKSPITVVGRKQLNKKLKKQPKESDGNGPEESKF